MVNLYRKSQSRLDYRVRHCLIHTKRRELKCSMSLTKDLPSATLIKAMLFKSISGPYSKEVMGCITWTTVIKSPVSLLCYLCEGLHSWKGEGEITERKASWNMQLGNFSHNHRCRQLEQFTVTLQSGSRFIAKTNN